MTNNPTATFGRRAVAAPALSRILPAVPLDDADRGLAASHGPSWRFPFAACAIALVLAIVFMIELWTAVDLNGPAAPGHFSLMGLGALDRTQALGAGEWWRLFTAPALHASTEHLIGNLIALLAAGALLEPRIGSAWFALIYCLGGLGGAVLSMLVNPPDLPTVGASGAIMACVAALYALSFHDCAIRPRLMRRVAGFLLFPALVPSVTDGGASVDIYCHVGGMLVGVALTFAILISWRDEEEALPPGRLLAAVIPMVFAAVTAWAFVETAGAFAGFAAQSADYIPAAELSADMTKMQAKSYQLVRKYPNDPRAHLFRGFAFLAQNDAPAAEQQLRLALRLDQERPGIMPAQLRSMMQALLALVLEALGRHGEALKAADGACANPPDQRLATVLSNAHLCR